MKKLTTYLMAMFVAVALLTACGGGNTNTANTKTDADTAAKTSNDASATDVTPKKKETKTAKNDTTNTASDSTSKDTSTTAQGKFVEGTFVEIEQGDLFHFIVKDEQGKSYDFWVMKTDATYEKISLDQAKYKGKKIKVFYKKSKKFIENAGGEIEFQEYVKAELK